MAVEVFCRGYAIRTQDTSLVPASKYLERVVREMMTMLESVAPINEPSTTAARMKR